MPIARLRRDLKSIGKLKYIPIVFNWFIIPLLVISSYMKYGQGETAYGTFGMFTQYFIPFLSSWWIIFCFAEFVEADGNELLFVYERSKLKDFFLLLGAYFISLLPSFILYGFLFDNLIWDVVVIIIDCILFAGTALLLMLLTSSAACSLLVVIGYSFTSILVTEFDIPIIYYHLEAATMEIVLNKFIYYLMIGVVFIAVGGIINKRYRHYN